MSRKKVSDEGRSRGHYEDSVERLFCFDLLEGLSPEEQAAVLAQMEYRVLEPGEVLVHEGDPAKQVFFLFEGELAVRSQGHLMGLVEAPHTLGLVALLDEEGRAATLEAFERCELFCLDEVRFEHLFKHSGRFARNVARYLVGELREAYGREKDLHQNLEDFFLSPNARIVPGPYRAEPFEMLIFLMRWEPGRLKALLPPGLSPIPGLSDLYLLTFSFFPALTTVNPVGQGKKFRYNETVPFIPALGPGLRPGAFCPELYPDNVLAILLGRELYGFPKRYGTTRRSGNRVDFTVSDRMAARASFAERRMASPAEFAADFTAEAMGGSALPDIVSKVSGAAYELLFNPERKLPFPFVRLFLRKQIPDVTSTFENVYQVDELVELPFKITTLESYQFLREPKVRFFDSDFFIGGEPVSAFSVQMAFEFGAGKHLIDYLDSDPGACGGWLSRFRSSRSRTSRS
jgi:CRP-like cAMP-binding protein